jgi:hypothetical protein
MEQEMVFVSAPRPHAGKQKEAEDMSNLLNNPNRPSSVGRVPLILPHRPRDRKPEEREIYVSLLSVSNHSPSFAMLFLYIPRFESCPSSEGISPPTVLLVS